MEELAQAHGIAGRKQEKKAGSQAWKTSALNDHEEDESAK